jgi:hypothetical protein
MQKYFQGCVALSFRFIDKADVVSTGARGKTPNGEEKSSTLNCGLRLGFARHDGNSGRLFQAGARVIFYSASCAI